MCGGESLALSVDRFVPRFWMLFLVGRSVCGEVKFMRLVSWLLKGSGFRVKCEGLWSRIEVSNFRFLFLVRVLLILSSLESSETKGYETQMRARLGITAHFCRAVEFSVSVFR